MAFCGLEWGDATGRQALPQSGLSQGQGHQDRERQRPGGSRGASEGDFPQTHLQIPQSWTGRQRGSQGRLPSALCNTAGVRCPPARTGAALGVQVAAWGSCLLSGPLIASTAPWAEGPRQKHRQGGVSHWDARSLCLPRPVTSLRAGSCGQGRAKGPGVQAPLGIHGRVQSSGSPASSALPRPPPLCPGGGKEVLEAPTWPEALDCPSPGCTKNEVPGGSPEGSCTLLGEERVLERKANWTPTHTFCIPVQ